MENEFQYRLLKAIAAKEMSAAELSRITGIDKGAMSNYINGKYIPKQLKIYKLAKALGVDPGWLATGDEPPKKSGETIELLVADDKQELEELISLWRCSTDVSKQAAMAVLKSMIEKGL